MMVLVKGASGEIIAKTPSLKDKWVFSITQFGAGASADYSNVRFGFGVLADVLSATYVRIEPSQKKDWAEFHPIENLAIFNGGIFLLPANFAGHIAKTSKTIPFDTNFYSGREVCIKFCFDVSLENIQHIIVYLISLSVDLQKKKSALNLKVLSSTFC